VPRKRPAAAARRADATILAASALSTWPDAPVRIAETRPGVLHPRGSGAGKSGTVVTWLSLFSRTDTRKIVELRGFEPLTSCMPYKIISFRNVAGCGPTGSFNRWTSPGIARYRCSLAPRLAPLSRPLAQPSMARNPRRIHCRVSPFLPRMRAQDVPRLAPSLAQEQALAQRRQPTRAGHRASPGTRTLSYK
jgi:hypothetical protein